MPMGALQAGVGTAVIGAALATAAGVAGLLAARDEPVRVRAAEPVGAHERPAEPDRTELTCLQDETIDHFDGVGSTSTSGGVIDYLQTLEVMSFLRGKSFTIVASTPEAVTYAFQEGGLNKILVQATPAGSGWIPGMIRSCNEVH